MDIKQSNRQKIKEDMKIFALRDGSELNLKVAFRLFFLTGGFQFVFCRRVQDMVCKVPVIGRPIRRVLWWMTCMIFGSEIAIDATVGGGLYIPHPYGIVLGAATIGRNVTILQHVTIGRRARGETADPVIEDGVYLAAGAVIIGSIVVGENARVGANSVLLQDLPAGATAVGIPAVIKLPQAG